MERQFNRQYSVQDQMFRRDLLVRAYRGRISWTKGKVPKRVGRVLYQILIEGDTWIRHANQLRKGFTNPDHDQSDDLRTLFEMFDLKHPSQKHTFTPLNGEHTGPVEPSKCCDHTRRPTRTRKRSRLLSMELQRRTYEDAEI
ncbi:unnamed protein product [Toxocara canis]|uniref:Transposase n=1 Tax=Toxocara canis TaxID=6265 RepID=A0A183UQN6_TOXCA|nr:unnamed protein product [Toxocara canis]